DTFKIAFASALPLHVVDLVLQAIDLSLGEDKDKSLEYFTAKKSS
ncbi:ATP-binding protein, partial [Salmonella enterica]|nr:ATP-binding protein [Salmonella enterica]